MDIDIEPIKVGLQCICGFHYIICDSLFEAINYLLKY
jgi:hypothetical protein